jgi:hypothetical protein
MEYTALVVTGAGNAPGMEPNVTFVALKTPAPEAPLE